MKYKTGGWIIKYLILLIFFTISLNIYSKEYGRSSVFDIPQREISIIATEEGYYPEKLAIFQGEKVRFFVTSTTKRPSCFIMNSQEVFLTAEKGKISEGVGYFDRPGTYRYHCPTGKLQGKIIVMPKRVEMKREVASKKESAPIVNIWIPK